MIRFKFSKIFLVIQQTSGRSSPESEAGDDNNTQACLESIVIHKSNTRCLTCDGKGKSEGYNNGSASLPAKFTTRVQCPDCNGSFNDAHTLDVSKMKRYSKIRPTILSPNCDINRDSDVNDSDAKH